MLGRPESLRYARTPPAKPEAARVKILRIGLSAGNPLAGSPQRPYAAHPNVEVEGEEMVQTATPHVTGVGGW
jgi:hypothetical protein